MGNGLAAPILDVGTVELKLNSGKIIHLKNEQHARSINKNLITRILLCRGDNKFYVQ